MKAPVDFTKLKQHIESKNSALVTLLYQILKENGEHGLEKAACNFANIAAGYCRRFLKRDKITTIDDVIQILSRTEYFVICGNAESKAINENEMEIKIYDCQFEKNKVLCGFTYNFLLEILRQIFENKMVIVTRKILGETGKCCCLNFEIKKFQHIEVLHLH